MENSMTAHEKAKENFNKELLKFKSRQEMFNHFFKYDDGKLYWKNGCYKSYTGKEAGVVGANSWKISIRSFSMRRTRVIYEMHFGNIVENLEIMHIDGNAYNDKLENLALSNRSLTMLSEVRLKTTNTSGFKGVSWNKLLNKWSSYITKDYKHMYLGSYFDKSDAINIYNIVSKNIINLTKEEIKEIVKKYKQLELAA
jgi:hypothetical protein